MYNLRVSNLFKNLIRPLTKDEYEVLEENLLRDGCLDPLVVWNGFIIDGHNRFEICTRLGIPYKVREMEFGSNEDAIAWICANQLGRRNISEETRKYLIGKRYEAEKIVGLRKCGRGANQYTYEYIGDDEEIDEKASVVKYKTAQRLGQEYHVSPSTVKKYGRYSRALDRIQEKESDIVPGILSGQIKISHENVMEMSTMKPTELRKVKKIIEGQGESFVPYRDTRTGIKQIEGRRPQTLSGPSIKDMPEEDPDAEVAGLTLTIPSWASSIERVKTKADISAVSAQALMNLQSALNALQKNIADMLDSIKEASDHE